MKKRILSILLLCCMVLTMLPTTVLAADGPMDTIPKYDVSIDVYNRTSDISIKDSRSYYIYSSVPDKLRDTWAWDKKIFIKGDKTAPHVFIDGVNIEMSPSSKGPAIELNKKASAYIYFIGKNSSLQGADGRAAIQKNRSEGQLYVLARIGTTVTCKGGDKAAGIGGSYATRNISNGYYNGDMYGHGVNMHFGSQSNPDYWGGIIAAIGGNGGAGIGGGHDEREQTLNQLLVEMDGFDANDGVIVMAATNRADILDKALLRPGRFDRQVYVGLPDVKGREEILKVHTKNKPLAPDVSLRVIAQRTAGFAGADLENLVNEAALLAARRNRKAITMEDIEEASMKVMAGPEKKSRVVTAEEKKLTAYHEAGHAVAGFYCKHHPRVHEITIIPRGQAGGYTMYLPEKDPSYVTKTAMNENIVCLLGGRVAEQLVLDDISTGASNDLQRATDTARAMVTRYGFSERMGPVVYGTDPGETFLGRDFGQGKGYSENTASEIDNEIRDIMDESYETARRILTEHMTELHRVAGVLMEREKISGEEFDALMKGENLAPFGLDTPAPAAAPASAEQPAASEQPSEPSDEN